MDGNIIRRIYNEKINLFIVVNYYDSDYFYRLHLL